ncbi:replication-relaxation family protein [Siminovitchia fortis]|uniref:Replication-relaxation n=1 Tax=Siminovitchia fortis TaxID=254758 RepID=A0A443IIP8_9BACI|nr:replication-relaxation family protein [Siminovitchia fortis]RWR04129.1 hypothetical protein D4N35_017505 [Siminovitchia fortis]WHY83038.1 replication-relaxation family protein [Siminovitchia fortis]
MNRTEKILTLIDRLGVASVRQLHEILRLGTYRNTCRVINKLSPYLHEVRSREKIVYLNKDGRELIASVNEIKKSMLFDHMLLTNDAYIYFNCPHDWRREYAFESSTDAGYGFAIQVKGLTTATTKKLVADAMFSRNGYIYLIEIDNTRHMADNIKKVKRYKEMWTDIQKKSNMQPFLYFITLSESRKRKLQTACKGMRAEVLTFDEIR